MRLLLPSALLVAVRLEAFAAFVFRHLETALFLQVTHGVRRICPHRAAESGACKAFSRAYQLTHCPIVVA